MSLYFYEIKHNGLGLNDTDETSITIDMSEFRILSYYSKLASGDYGSTVLEVQCSCCGAVWETVASSDLIGTGIKCDVVVSCRYARIKVKTAAGGAGTADLIIQLKK